MSSTLSNIQLGTSVATLDGLSIINADQLFVDGQNVNPSAPNIPINPTSTNATYAPVFTNSFASQSSGALLVDANFGLTFNPATDTLGTTNLYTNGTIYVGGVSTGTPSYYIGVNSSNNIVKFSAPTVPVPNQINVIGNTGYSQLYPAFLTSNSSGDQNIFVDTAGNTIYYNEVTQTLVVVNLNSTTLTTTGLITANTLKIDSVPAGTTAKYLAINATGNVIEADITTKYVPYTGATANVNLNAKNLSGVVTYSGTNVQVTSTETTSLLATGLAQLGSLRISSVPAGTQTNLLAVDSTGNVIIGTAPAPSQLNLSPTVAPTLYYFPFITSSSAGVQTVYTDNAVITLTYNTSTKTLSPYRLNIQNVPAGTQTSLLAIDSAGNVIQGTSTPQTQLLTTRTTVTPNPIYYPTFVSTNTTGDKSYYVPYPSTGGWNIYYHAGTALGDIGRLNVPQLVVPLTCVLPATATSFDGVPLTGGIPIIYGLGIDANNLIKAYTVGAPYVNVTDTNQNYYPVFVATSSTSGIKDLYQDTIAGHFAYNPSTNLLTVQNLTVSGTTTITGYAPLASPAFTGVPTAPTAGSGTNTTQLATTAFVQTAVAGITGYLPLAGGTMTGTINFASGTNNLLSMYYNKFNQYTNYIIDGGGNQYIAIATDAPSASPSPLVGTLSLLRNTSITGTLTNSSTLVSTGKITGNGGLTITNASVLYANIGIGGVNNIYADTQFWTSGGANGVMQISYGSGVNQNIDSATSYNWQTTNAGVGTTRLNLSASQVAFRMGSMVDFSTAITWDNSNSLFVTTGGNGGTNYGVGFGFNSTLGLGLLVSLAPNVAWTPMRYKASSHQFYSANTSVVTINGSTVSSLIPYVANTGYPVCYFMPSTVGNNSSFIIADSFATYTSPATTFCRIFGTSGILFQDSNAGFQWRSVPLANPYGSSTQLMTLGSSGLTVGTANTTTISNSGTVLTNTVQKFSGDFLSLNSKYINLNCAFGGGYSYFSSGDPNAVWLGYSNGSYCGGMFYQSGGYHQSNHIQVSSQITTASSVTNGAGVFVANGQNGYGFDFWTYGYGATGASTSVYVISNWSGSGVQMAAGSTSWGAYSDRRCKKNVCCIADGHKHLMRLKPVQYKYLTDEKFFPDKMHRHGFVAQEFAEVYPEHVSHNNPPYKDVDGTEIENPISIHMVEIIPDIVDSVQYLTHKAQRHKDRIIVLEETVQEQKSQITKQQEQIQQQQSQIDLLLKHVGLLTEQVNELTKTMKK